MRIGVVTTSYPRRPGDLAGAFVAGHARSLRAAGHEVEVVCAGPGARRVDGIRVARGAGWGLAGAEGVPDRLARTPWRALGAVPLGAGLAARTLLRVARWDALVAHWLVPAGVLCATVARGRRLLVVAHGGDVHLVARPGFADAVLAPLARADARLVVVAAHLHDALARAARTRLVRRWLEGALVQPMGVDDAAAWPGPPAAPTVLYLGRLVPLKGVDVLLEACARLDGVRLLVAGDGPERARLDAKARALGVDARFLGAVPTDARAALFARASVLAVPSRPLGGRGEGTPLVALEARAAGLPVVASALGGLPDALAGAAAAWLVPPGDPRSLADALADALATPARPARPDATLAWATVGPRLLEHLS